MVLDGRLGNLRWISVSTHFRVDARDTVNIVLKHYGDKSPQWLSDLTHMEEPWRTARVGVPEGARSGNEITHASMAEYYGGLLPEN